MITPTAAIRSVVERNLVFYRHRKFMFAAGFFEPMIWLFGIGIGVGELVGGVDVNGETVEYGMFVAPGLIAVSAMNGAAFESTYNFYYKLRYSKLFDSMVVTPLRLREIVVGELSFAVLRSSAYATGFLVLAAALGFIESWWGLFIIPTTLLIGTSVAALGVWSTTFMRNWHDFDYLGLMLQFLFMCSATFFPIDVFPGWAQAVVRATPLYHGVAVCRELALGSISTSTVAHIAYMVGVTVLFGWLANRRLDKWLLS